MRYIVFVCCCLFLFIACSGERSNNEVDSHNLRVFGSNPQITALLEIVYPEGLVGLNYLPYPEDIPFMPHNVSQLPVLGMFGGGKTLSFEKIMSLKPDIIFFGDSVPKEVWQQYENAGIKVVLLKSDSLENALDNIDTIASVLPIESKPLQDFIKVTYAKIEDLQTRVVQRPRIYFAQGINGLQTQCAKDSLDSHELAFRIGGVNAMQCGALASEHQYAHIDYETLIHSDPDVIFVREIGLYKEIKTNPSVQWQALSAVRNNKVFYAPSSPSNWLTKPQSIMQIIGVPWAFSKIHPELLSDEEALKIVQEFFERFLVPLDSSMYAILQGEK